MAKTTKTPATEIAPYLKSVRIRDYAPLRDAKADFKPGLNIIIGPNGAGKTRFLSLTNNMIDPYNGNHLDGLGCEFAMAGPYEIRAKFIEQADSRDDLRRVVPLYAPNARLPLLAAVTYNSARTDTLSLYAAIDELMGRRFSLYWPVLIQHGIPARPLPIIDDGTELIVRVFRGKAASIVSIDTAAKNLDSVGSKFIQELCGVISREIRHGLYGQSIPAAIAPEAARKVVAQAVDDYLSQLNHYLPLYSPINAVRRSETFQVYHNTLQDELTIKGLVLEYQVGTAWLSFNNLSDGTKRLFYIISEMLLPLGRHKKSKIIFLEEPELGIHPDQLQLLLGLIRETSRTNQVILTTHSPQVLDMLTKNELDRITICELDPQKGTQFRKLSAARKAKAKAYMRDDSYLSDFWRFSNLEAPE